jgi:hypothetical protein
VAAVLALALALGACGVPNDGEPRGVASGDVPGGLLVPSTTQALVPDDTGPALFPTTVINAPPIDVFLVDSAQDRVVRVDRNNPAPKAGASLLESAQAAADVLLQPPLSLERQVGYTTTLTSTAIRAVRIDDEGTLEIEVDEFPRDPAEQPLAMAQIIWTLTSVDGVRRVRVFRDGQPQRVPLWAGGEAEPGRALDRSDYIGAVGTPASPETTSTAAPSTAPVPTTTIAPPPPEPPPEGEAPPEEGSA